MSTENKIAQFQEEEARRENLEHRDVLLSIGVLLKQKEGQELFKYLFKNLEVTCTPEGLEGNALYEYLGLLKAGNSIYKLVCEADPEIAANILSKIERERYERLYEEHRLYND